MKTSEPSLPDKMLSLAEKGHPRSDELRCYANALVRAVQERADAKQLLGAWARARRIWCECTGEPLV